MPGYTHLQRAQPVPVAHHLMAYEAMLARDRARVHDAGGRAGESPLGAGALAATTLPIDREAAAGALGFTSVTRNSMDAVGDRDFAVELVAAAALCQVHLSRLAEEMILWSSQEFGFVHLSEAYCSGSSLMPHKVNPDVAELVRGKTGRVVGDWVALMTALKGAAAGLQQGPTRDAGAALRRCRHRDRVAAAHDRHGPDHGDRSRGGDGGGRRAGTSSPPSWPTTWSGAGCRSARRTTSSARWCARPRSAASS